ncbi:tripartite tricarboxylate transporter substrate binding protein [Pseudorhodoplanes sp.]|uniref:Bug family tripartite tricarboxylate transporter substrate binding protein n=1 Tax=Pseudorhodoplanes sp. TaxID=1934341 RepID=UPI002C82C329|nr:tripartite tricarboxylate transporter substrate binding protein [Pseudorhodoplanes sp.]HWV43770.1 tripartite tricarboxylate transporter substrate binding protein [Pseudorhodoplanes sp.]
MKIFRMAIAGAILAVSAGVAMAQDWPTKPLRIVVPFPAGGSADTQTRVIADELSKALGQAVVIENKPGAGGNIGAAEAARAQPDGYTLFMATTGTHASNVSLYDKLPYDPVKDFAPLTMVTIYPQVVVPSPKMKDASFKDMIAQLKAAGDKSNFGSSGTGSPTHLGGELFKRATGTQMVHVPYRGQGPALNDMLGGQLDVMFPSISDVLSFLQSGKLRAIAVMNDKRLKQIPDVPTMAELGYPGVTSSIWTGLYTKAGTPQPVIDRLHKELVTIVNSPAFKDKFEALGFEVRTSTPQELAQFTEAETKRWGDIIKSLNIKAQ